MEYDLRVDTIMSSNMGLLLHCEGDCGAAGDDWRPVKHLHRLILVAYRLCSFGAPSILHTRQRNPASDLCTSSDSSTSLRKHNGGRHALIW
jgi:hypothetical protein